MYAYGSHHGQYLVWPIYENDCQFWGILKPYADGNSADDWAEIFGDYHAADRFATQSNRFMSVN